MQVSPHTSARTRVGMAAQPPREPLTALSAGDTFAGLDGAADVLWLLCGPPSGAGLSGMDSSNVLAVNLATGQCSSIFGGALVTRLAYRAERV